ncbi:substrate-binding periplasmic protein [Bdellovibrio sp. HCB337]|uniref:substrate-binding periplasmic protein n=1 Tax=Bdellovibrio sp. HCB337 TaxID=3394358 RepID=UPI0039A67BCF
MFLQSSFGAETKALSMDICFLERNFLPFTDQEEQGQWQRLVKAAAAEAGVQVRMFSAPRSRCLNEGARGTSDAIFSSALAGQDSVMVFPKKDGILDTSKAVGKPVFRVYVKKGSKVTWDGVQFQGLGDGAVGVQTGLYTLSFLEKMNVKVDPTEGAAPTLAKLNLGRVSAAVLNEEQVEVLAKDIQMDQIEALPIAFASAPIFLPISKSFYKNHPTESEKLWSAIQKLSAKFQIKKSVN